MGQRVVRCPDLKKKINFRIQKSSLLGIERCFHNLRISKIIGYYYI